MSRFADIVLGAAVAMLSLAPVIHQAVQALLAA